MVFIHVLMVKVFRKKKKKFWMVNGINATFENSKNIFWNEVLLIHIKDIFKLLFESLKVLMKFLKV